MVCIDLSLAFFTMNFLHVNIVKIILFYGLLLFLFYILSGHMPLWIVYFYIVISINQIYILKKIKIMPTFSSLWSFAEKPCYFIIGCLIITYLHLWGVNLKGGIDNDYMLKSNYNDNIIPLYILVVFSIIYYSLPIIKNLLVKFQAIADKKNEELNKNKQNLIEKTKIANKKRDHK